VRVHKFSGEAAKKIAAAGGAAELLESGKSAEVSGK
jgi:ribosomal protein L15